MESDSEAILIINARDINVLSGQIAKKNTDQYATDSENNFRAILYKNIAQMIEKNNDTNLPTTS